MYELLITLVSIILFVKPVPSFSFLSSLFVGYIKTFLNFQYYLYSVNNVKFLGGFLDFDHAVDTFSLLIPYRYIIYRYLKSAAG